MSKEKIKFQVGDLLKYKNEHGNDYAIVLEVGYKQEQMDAFDQQCAYIEVLFVGSKYPNRVSKEFSWWDCFEVVGRNPDAQT